MIPPSGEVLLAGDFLAPVLVRGQSPFDSKSVAGAVAVGMWTTPFRVVQAKRHVHGVAWTSGLLAWLRAGAAQTFPCELEAVCVVDEAIENGVGGGGSRAGLMPGVRGPL